MDGAEVDSLGITNCTFYGYDRVGALAGYSTHSSTVSCCYSSGFISGNNYTGGLVGYNSSSTVQNCYSTTKYTGEEYVGGLIAINRSSTTTDCYFTGSVIGTSDVGYFTGRNSSSELTNCYYNNNISNDYDGIGEDDYDQTITGLSTDEMKQSTNFENWDFTNMWEITDGTTFPRLQNVEDAPIILQNISQTTYLNTTYKDTIEVIPMDAEIDSIHLIESPSEMKLINDSIIVWSPKETGDTIVKILVSDKNGLYNYCKTNINVIYDALQTDIDDNVNESFNTDIYVYPNPVLTKFILKNISGDGQLSIYNYSGNIVYYSSLILSGQSIDISSLPDGIYILKIKDKRGLKKLKITKVAY